MGPHLAGERKRRSRRISYLAFCLLLGAVVVMALVKLSQPLGGIRRQQEELTRLRLEKNRLTASKTHLEGYQHSLATDRGLERAARREGYIRRGDRRIVLVPEQGGDKKTTAEGAGAPAPQ